uniref:DDE Tnp4 domain-containing protein n=1 Tax=Denticeps clupeoides TaxID=299321 RepID=A0AAY4BK22_9TELE
MVCPFLDEPVDLEAQILCRNLRQERMIRPRVDVLSFLDEYLYERFHFSRPSVIYNILSPHISNMTHRGNALRTEQILCVALCFFANGSFLYNIGDAEHVSKATVCRAVRNVTLALKRLLCTFAVFPGHRTTRQAFHRIAGISLLAIYPCQHHLLTPYPDPEPGPQQRYNIAHRKTQVQVEMTIGMHKAQFQCLRMLRVTPERACDIIVACVVLHNIATIRGEQNVLPLSLMMQTLIPTTLLMYKMGEQLETWSATISPPQSQRKTKCLLFYDVFFISCKYKCCIVNPLLFLQLNSTHL